MKITTFIRSVFNKLNIDIVRLHNSPEKTLLGLTTKKIDCILDVGANRGQFAKYISKIFPRADIYCFEPLAGPFSTLRDWADTQNGRVRCFNLALGDEPCEIQMHLHINHTPSSSILNSTPYGRQVYPQTRAEAIENVKVETLDRIFLDSDVPKSKKIMLKLDVQGFEDRVLRGATSLLVDVDVCLLEVCLDPLYESQADFQDLVMLLYRAGFRYAGNILQAYGEDGHVIYIDALFTKKGE